MIDKASLYFHTLKHLRCRQISYRTYYYIRNKYKQIMGVDYNFNRNRRSSELLLNDSIQYTHSLDGDTFTFLNLSKKFTGAIDWNFNEYGKLWLYNLAYFDYIIEKKTEAGRSLTLINDFISTMAKNKVALEAYPTSIRCINWIKFLTKNRLKDSYIDAALYSQYLILVNNLEYHLLGNHLLENAFSLLFGAYYFNDSKLYKKATVILMKELDEQVLNDGGHFELSPMYHQLILLKLLDCVNLIKNNAAFNGELLAFLNKKAARMLRWCNEITFANGNIPLLNDSAYDIAPTTTQLNQYALRLGIIEMPLTSDRFLNESGYRKIRNTRYEILIDIGNIGPDYLPGHAHCDTFSFELHIDKKPLIVDTGISTYEANALRLQQRRTAAHNTVAIENYEQSEIWGSFRVARRAYVENVKENYDNISASQNGYKRIGAIHTRCFKFLDDRIIIQDLIISQNNYRCFSYLHFHPEVAVCLKDNVAIANNVRIIFKQADHLEIQNYQYAPEFNKLMHSSMIIAQFYRALTIEVVL